MSLTTLLVGYLWAALAYVFAGLIALFVKIERDPDPWRSKDFSEVKPLISFLLRRGYDKGYVDFAHKKSGRFFWFQKVIREKGDFGLQLCFPKQDWSESYFQALKAHCEETDLPYRLQTESFKERPMEFLAIHCRQDVDQAYELAAMVWTELFGLPLDAWYQREGDGISMHDELVDSPDHPRPSEEEIRRHRWQLARQDLRRVKLSLKDVIYSVVLTLLALISIIGLPVATLISIGDPPEWTIDLGGVPFAGSSASFYFFLAYLFSFAVLRQLLKEKFKYLQECAESRYERFYGAGLRLIVVSLPLAVILIWAGV